MSDQPCPFCDPQPAERIFYEDDLTRGLWDGFPVSPGHALLIPRRHVATWFDVTAEEQAALMRALSVARDIVAERHRPDGYNVGINVGEAAGQTVFHLHVHLIPRYSGDIADPRGGVRHVIPSKGNYLLAAEPGTEGAPGEPRRRALVRGGEDDPLLPHILANIDESESIDMAVAFVLLSGVRRIEPRLRDLLARGGSVRLLTGDYMDVTDPDALLRLLDLEGRFELRVFEARGTSFHPKAYIFHSRGGGGITYVGSSNLTEPALTGGVEWNYRVVSSEGGCGFADVAASFEEIFRHPSTRPVDAEWVAEYRRRRRKRVVSLPPAEVEEEAPEAPPAPHEVQAEALVALEATRREGNSAGLVVLATGLGKTWLSAFDSDRPEYKRVLFVAHRDEILAQAMQTFRRVRPQAVLGRYTGKEKNPVAEVVFASVQTLGLRRHLERFDPREFDYAVVDEFHHASAPTYRRLIDHFRPRFLLGLTATPERTDGGDLLALCQENLVYRCDLSEGIRRGLLSPFHYFGVPDEVDYANIPWRGSRFDEEALTQAVATRSRAQNALEQYRKRAGARTLAFCCSRLHADFMAEYFRAEGLRAVAVHSGEGSAPRAASLEKLEAGELDAIFAVDIFNEGLDVPQIDTVMMLRPTESRVLWLQQFGRGLRRAEGKNHLTVIDYIGNHRSFLVKPQALFELGSAHVEISRALYLLRVGSADLPPGVAAELQKEVGESIRIQVLPDKDDAGYRQMLADGLRGARVHNQDEIVQRLSRIDPGQLAQLIQVNAVDELEQKVALGGNRTQKILDAFRANINPFALEAVQTDDKIVIELNVTATGEPNFKDAAELSRGQKCTAILPLLLARRNTPLVIDQPEDNLDNHFIYETVVESIRRLKPHRQMIFITHNANIPVLAEADLVVALDSDGRTGRVTKRGTLDDCREEVIDLLEGGKTAFDMRRQRYGRP